MKFKALKFVGETEEDRIKTKTVAETKIVQIMTK